MGPGSRTPLTAYQRDVWTASGRAPGDPQFNCYALELFPAGTDLAVLRECLAAAARANDALCLRFDDDGDGVPAQWVDTEPPEVAIVDFTAEPVPAEAREAWIAASFDRPFPLRGTPLCELAVLKESDDAVYAYVKVHHIVADAWSLGLLLTQVRDGYGHRVRTGVRQPVTAPSYLAVAAAEAAYRDSPEYDRDRDHLREAFDGVTPALFARRQRGFPADTGFHRFTIGREVLEGVRAEGLEPFPYLAAVIATYLSRVHDSEDVVLGVPLLNRRGRSQLRTVGQFANTLPLRVAVDHGRTLRDVHGTVRDAARELKRHERFPLGDLMRELRPAETGVARLFDVSFAYIRASERERAARIPAVAGAGQGRARVHEQEALAVIVHEPAEADDLVVDLSYARDVFDADFPIDAAARHIGTLARDGLTMLDKPLSAVSMLTPAERDDLVYGRNTTGHAYDREGTLHGLFSRRAAEHPDRVAVVGAGVEPHLTFRELDRRGNQLARSLAADGVRPGERVAVMMERGPEMLVAILGVLKAGAVYVPVDPDYPAERVRFLVEDSGAKVVVRGSGDGPAPQPRGVTIRSFDTMLGGTAAPLGPMATSRDLAYVIYTSGSTGVPKGVMVEHHSVVNRLAWMQRRYPIGAGDVLLQKTAISFDVSIWELFWWAVEGAAVALLRPGGEKDPDEIVRAIVDHGVTAVHFVPSMLGPFLDALEAAPDLLGSLGSLRHVFCSGEALPPGRVEQFGRVFAATRGRPALVNLYGPTEATVDVSYFDCPTYPASPVARVPIGRPIDNTQLYVLDRYDQPQPVGAPGELCIGGVGVARGYLGRPELTRERFVADPFVAGGRLYRSGDRARWLADGTIEYLGRADRQVKIRGFRVELGEVQNQISAVPGVGDAVVVDRKLDGRPAHLVGYYVAGVQVDPAQVRDQLAEALPDFMIPSYLVRLDRLPLLPNGKVNHRALPPPAGPDRTAQAPRTDVEAAIAELWSSALGDVAVGVHDDFFVLGGDSILMLSVRAEAMRRGLRFSLSDMVRHPTVAGLAAVVEAGTAPDANAGPAPFALVASVDRGRLAWAEDAFPVTRLQLGMLYHSHRYEGTATYQDVFRYRLDMPWHEAAFRRAAASLVRRHPVLRSSFDLAGHAVPMQVIHRSVPDRWDVVDLREATAAAAEDAIRGHVDESRYRRYRFDQPPLWHLRVHRLPSTVDLVFSFHHAILDGWSVASVIGDLLHDYVDEVEGRSRPARTAPPPPAHQALGERLALESAESKRYWQDTLAGAAPLRLESLRQSEPPAPEEPIVRWDDLPDGLDEAIQRFAKRYEVPVKSVFLAAHCLLLRHYGGSGDVVTGLVAHGRPELPGADETAGLFLNTIPFRLDAGPRTWLQTVRATYLREREAHPHRRYPLSAIEADHPGGLVVRTAFNYVHLWRLGRFLRESAVTLVDVETWEETDLTFALNAILDPRRGRVRIRFDCDGRTFTRAQADLYARAYVHILTRLVDRPHEPVDFAFLADEFAPAGARDAGQPAGLAEDVVRQFTRQAARIPDAVAVAFREDAWTYRELDRVSDRIARRLLASGARAGASVGVALDRSPEMIATVLGIAKTGAACVPLDVSYPKERLAIMLEQAQPLGVVADPAYAALVQPSVVLRYDDLAADRPDPDGSPGPDIDPHSVAYLVFTSGSTGVPKCVEMPHRALGNLVRAQLALPTGGPATTLQFAPLSFDVAFQEIYATLCGGGTLRMVCEDERRNAGALLRLLDRAEVERAHLPYVALQHLAEGSVRLGIRPRALRMLVCGGEQVRVTDEIRQFCAALPGTLLENQYGPAETHLVTRFTMTGDPATFPSLPPIGSAVGGVEVHVLDDQRRPVPPGVAGEIYLGGECLAHGYRGQRELTEQRFVPHPQRDGARLYRTGDIGLVLPGGEISWLGRADNQIKIRGFRVEPAEVELAITRAAGETSGIRQAAVVARHRGQGDAVLVAYLVGDSGAVDLHELKSRLRLTLPDYMVPAHFLWLDALPLTPSGKRDDAALRRRPLREATAADVAPPRDDCERLVAELLEELLDIPAIGIHENIFDLGATSLTAMRLAMLVERRFGVSVSLPALVAGPTIAAIATRIRDRERPPAFDPLVPLRREGERPPLFLAHPIGGNVLCYLRLAEHLAPDQPLYALQAAGGEPGTEPLRSMPELARSYLAAIRQVQPHGPYAIGGWSFGGFVAFEMARQLRLAGEEVSQLILIDSIALRPDSRPDVTDHTLLEWFFWDVLWLGQGADTPVEELPGGLPDEEKLAFIGRRASAAGVLPQEAFHSAVRRLYDVFLANWQAMIDYRPTGVDLDITLLRAKDPLPDVLQPIHAATGTRYLDATNGWAELTSGRVDVIEVPGDHIGLLEEPSVATAATVIAELVGGRYEPIVRRQAV